MPERIVYVEKPCPAITVLNPVAKIEGNVTNGCVCGNQLKELFNGAKQLRKSEKYYIEQIEKYNSNFTHINTTPWQLLLNRI